MNVKDKNYIVYINKHYKELLDEIKLIDDDFIKFETNLVVQKAIKIDLFQIGELYNCLTQETQNKNNQRDIRGIIDVRNYIAHGYININDEELWNTIHNDLPRLIENLNN